ncbi:hypothetical protein CL633_03035 [bacterium]|nr:hypothetical protein [bacterium]|tara:strand:+ start:7058 stop:7837 length:780 start_codon:yes stop_codon:yes gene_type:complete
MSGNEERAMSVFEKAIAMYFNNTLDQKDPYFLRAGIISDLGKIIPGNKLEGKIKTYFSEYDKWPDAERKVFDFVSIGDPILDLGAGAGKNCLYLQELGAKDVHAVDISSVICEVMRKRGVIKVHKASMNELDKERVFMLMSFGTILLMHNSIAQVGTLEKLKKLFSVINSISLQGARIIATIRNPLHEQTSCLFNRVFKKEEIVTETARIEWKKEIGEWFKFLMIPCYAFEKIAQENGWEIIFKTGIESTMYGVVLEKK